MIDAERQWIIRSNAIQVGVWSVDQYHFWSARGAMARNRKSTRLFRVLDADAAAARKDERIIIIGFYRHFNLSGEFIILSLARITNFRFNIFLLRKCFYLCCLLLVVPLICAVIVEDLTVNRRRQSDGVFSYR